MYLFENNSINLTTLRERAYNLRWATVPQGVIPLTAADPDFPCAPQIIESIKQYAQEGYFNYGPPEGLPCFKESVADFFIRKRNVPVLSSNVLPTDSAAFGIYITCKTFLNKGDDAIIFDPVDFLFRYSIEAVGANAIPFQIAPGCKEIDFDLFERLITPKTKMFCLCNPLNPTGKVFTKAELEKFGELACKYNLIILSDEIWSDIVFAPSVFTSIASISEEIRNRTVTISGFSKSYGLAGLRIGFIVAHQQTIYSKLFDTSLHQSTIHGANVVSQIAATTALTSCDEWLENFLTHLEEMKNLCVKELNSMHQFKCIAPEGCYVAFVNITETNKSSLQIQELFMNKAKVAVVPGLPKWFGDGAEGYFRISFATSKEILSEAFNRMRNSSI